MAAAYKMSFFSRCTKSKWVTPAAFSRLIRFVSVPTQSPFLTLDISCAAEYSARGLASGLLRQHNQTHIATRLPVSLFARMTCDSAGPCGVR